MTIATEFTVRSGMLGAIERVLTARLLRGIHARELALLAACAAEAVTTHRGS